MIPSVGVGEHEAVFPWSLARDVFEIIVSRDIRVLRYADLEPSRLIAPSRLRYIDEFVRFHAGKFTPWQVIRLTLRLLFLRLGRRLPIYDWVVEHVTSGNSPTVILQHDADLLPERTLKMMALEAEYGLRSSAYFFVEHAQTRHYDLNIPAIREFERRGFEIGYHQNAYERSGYDRTRALELVEEDIAFLQEHFNIRSFVPHGGIPSPRGLNNLNLPQAGSLRNLLWAYNGRCILKEYTWSDGGIRNQSKTDPREFIRNVPNGTRAMMLMHPQYYSDELRRDWRELPISREPWWRELWGL